MRQRFSDWVLDHFWQYALCVLLSANLVALLVIVATAAHGHDVLSWAQWMETQ